MVEQGSDPDTPATGTQKLFIDSADGKLKRIDESDVVTTIEGGAGSDSTAIHDNVSGEISALTEKVTLHDNDLVIIEDSEASNAKKKAKIGNISGGGGGGSLELIEHQDKNAGAGADFTFDVTGLTFTHLIIKWGFKASGAAQNAQMQFNADTGNNYHYQFWHPGGVAPATGVAFIVMGYSAASGAGAGILVTGETRIDSFRNTNWHKHIHGITYDGPNNTIYHSAGRWANTVAITAIKLFLASGDLAQYSYADLYGVE